MTKKTKKAIKPLAPIRTEFEELRTAIENYELAFSPQGTPEQAVVNFKTYYPAVKSFVEDNVGNLLLDALQLHLLCKPDPLYTTKKHHFEPIKADSDDTYTRNFCKHCGKFMTHFIHFPVDTVTFRPLDVTLLGDKKADTGKDKP